MSYITKNKQIFYNYFIEQELEAGLILKGWEVKALRSGNVNISNSYITLKDHEAYIVGITINPLQILNKNQTCDTICNRKILLHKRELIWLSNIVKKKNYSIVVLSLYWKKPWAKAKIGIATGKKEFDKRHSIKEREWKIKKNRIKKYEK